MAGHNKWSKIRHKKAATDAAKSKIFSKYAQAIVVAVKNAGGDITSPSVQVIVDKAKKDNMPKDNIEKALKKGSGEGAAALEEVMYEGYGPGGCGIIIVGLTDNKNRTGQEVKHVFSKNGSSLGAQGSVSWGFTKNEDLDWVANPGTEVQLDENDESKLEKLIEAFEELDDVSSVYTNTL